MSPTPLPHRRPRSLHQFIILAARANFPAHNDGMHHRILERLLAKSTVGDGWVSRGELLALWGHKAPKTEEEQQRGFKKVATTVKRLEEQIRESLAWIFPHLRFVIQRRPENKTKDYRIMLRQKGAPWLFRKDEAAHTQHLNFTYQFKDGPVQVAKVRTWATASPSRTLAVEAVREPPEARWRPPSHSEVYIRLRDEFFGKEQETAKKNGQPELHDSHIWGIRDIHVNEGSKSTTVRILTEKSSYPNLRFLQKHLDQEFPPEPKKTYRRWLKLEPDPRGDYCPGRDGLCIYALVFTRKPEPTVFLAKQKGSGKWEATAAGAACGAHSIVDDEHPDLFNQVCGVLHKEAGLKTSPDRIKWLGVARGLHAECATGVLALVTTSDDVTQVMQKFKHRREKQDIEELVPVPLATAKQWLESIPVADRKEFLEVILALAAIDQKLAEAL